MNTQSLPMQALGNEQHYWIAENDGMRSRTAMSQASGEYRSAPVPKISGLDLSLPAALAASIEDAAAELSRFNSYTKAKLGKESPSLGPMSSILLRAESTSSSQIENLTVGARQLALAEIGESTSVNAQVVVANVRAMEAALELADQLDSSAILTMHRRLLEGQQGWEQHAGTYRTQLVWIGSSPVTPIGASHIAPQAKHVAPAIEDLVNFMGRDDLPVIAQAAIAHAQFETIHPFVDGNGRTGRALVHALMRSKGTVPDTTAPISAGLLRDTEGYFDALQQFRLGDARPIVERFADASRFAAHSGALLVNDLAEEIDSSRLRLANIRKDAAGWRVLPHLIAHPVVNAAAVKRLLATNDTTAQRALTQLCDAGILEERTGKQRARIWQNTVILNILDAYAQTIHRK